MICLETRHFNINRILLLIVGLWPYQRTPFVQFQLLLFFGTLTTFIIFQFTTFLTSKCTPELILKVFSTTFFFICLAIKYNSFWINGDIVRSLLEQLQEICNELKDENEIAIIEKYGSKAKYYTTVLILFGSFGEFTAIFIQIWPYIQYFVLPNNGSRVNHSLSIVTEYFIDQEKYFYLSVLHGIAACHVGAIAMVATGSMLIAYLQHACGMFSIASYRIKHAVNILQKDVKSESKVSKEIIYAVHIHRKAMEVTDFMISNFEGSFFFLIAVGISCLSLNLLRVASYSGNIEQIVLPLLIVTILYVYLFLSNYTAQEIIDHNEYVFATVYNVEWYVAPIHIQKMILFLLQRGTKAFYMLLGGIFVASLESAAALMSTSISYFTLLYSSKKD
ncbi:uncharacterized protein LOC105198346 isoform X2 [Solenopsis invicta]|uniref:uncharacterized protein LOC105198346 isoform X2 n=1 Tax=Solenopsis invicta TaxID=13686 RepID=UPI000E33E5D9|nr:uncharacterized protein LOC105198346 isoform X2 [Solenopsis invicta]